MHPFEAGAQVRGDVRDPQWGDARALVTGRDRVLGSDDLEESPLVQHLAVLGVRSERDRYAGVAGGEEGGHALKPAGSCRMRRLPAEAVLCCNSRVASPRLRGVPTSFSELP